MTPSTDARTQMTYQQIRAWTVLTPQELEVFEGLRREDFVPEGWRGAAYGDLAIPLGENQHMLTPTIVGGILQAVDLAPRDTVLEIGTGSGYLSACMARLAASVHSLEIRPQLARQARLNLQQAGIGNAAVEEADAFAWQPAAPAYDVIVLTGALPAYDARFESLLRPGGRLFMVTGHAPVMDARLSRLTAQGNVEHTSLFETVFDPLECPPAPRVFEF